MDINSFVLGFQKGKAIVPPAAGGGAELNIAYGDTAPEDTSKLWVKTSEPSGVIVSAKKIQHESYQMENLSQIGSITLKRERKSYPTSAAVGTKIYTIGGSTNATYGKQIESFDVETLETKNLGQILPRIKTGATCCAVGTKIYIFGGSTTGSHTDLSTDDKEILIFDTETNNITTSIKTWGNSDGGFFGSRCAAVGSVIVISGGRTKSGDTVGWITEFDTEQDKFLYNGTYMPEGTYFHGCAAVNGMVYFLGGTDVQDGNFSRTDAIYRYDIRDHSVKKVSATLPTVLTTMGCCVVENKIYLLGGYAGTSPTSSASPSSTVVCYDPTLDVATTCGAKLDYNGYNPAPMCDATASTVGTKAYLIGGIIGVNRYNAIIQYSPPLKNYVVENEKIQIVPKTTGDHFPIITADTCTVEIAVDSVLKGNPKGIGEKVEAALYKNGAWTTI